MADDQVYKGIKLTLAYVYPSVSLHLYGPPESVTAKTAIADQIEFVPNAVFDDYIWRISLTYKRSGFKLSDKERQAAGYVTTDNNAAGHIKFSKLKDLESAPFVEPLVDAVRIECDLFESSGHVDVKDSEGVGLKGVVEAVHDYFDKHPAAKKAAKGKDTFVSVTHVKGVTFRIDTESE